MEALKEQEPMSKLASKHKLHPNQITSWKKLVVDNLPSLFEPGGQRNEEEHEQQLSKLYEQIGRLQVERDWLKKNNMQC
jgi:putative transposase